MKLKKSAQYIGLEKYDSFKILLTIFKKKIFI